MELNYLYVAETKEQKKTIIKEGGQKWKWEWVKRDREMDACADA